MSKGSCPQFILQNEVYLVDNRPCKIFLPPVVIQEYGRIYWIQYLDDGDVTMTSEDKLVLTKRGKVLYGSKE